MTDTNSEPKKKMSLGKGCLIAIGAILGFGVLGAIVGGDKAGAPAGGDGAQAEAANTPPVQTTAKELEAAYAANEAAAQQQFGKKPLQVSATIRSIDLGMGDVPFLTLEGENMFVGPQAHLSEESQKQAASFKKGQEVVLLCAGVSEVVGTPILDDCTVQ